MFTLKWLEHRRFISLAIALLVVFAWKIYVLFSGFSNSAVLMSFAESEKVSMASGENNLIHPRLTEVSVSKSGMYETINETIARLKRDVVVTGTLLLGNRFISN